VSERGLYIAFEGWEASGKSTQAELLARRLDAVLSREPGGTDLGREIRELLLGDGPVPTSRAEALLFAADRAQHISEVVRPALEAGRHVVTDRSYGSTLAYQGHGRGQSLDDLWLLTRWASDGVLPDLVVLLEVPLGEADDRLGSERDRLEREAMDFSERVVAGFSKLAVEDPARWVVVDGSDDVDAVAERVWQAFEAWR
jgi:dTMP kinase